jgi:hypothetical protein
MTLLEPLDPKIRISEILCTSQHTSNIHSFVFQRCPSTDNTAGSRVFELRH